MHTFFWTWKYFAKHLKNSMAHRLSNIAPGGLITLEKLCFNGYIPHQNTALELRGTKGGYVVK